MLIFSYCWEVFSITKVSAKDYRGSGSTVKMIPHLKIHEISDTSFHVCSVHLHGCVLPA